MQFSVEVPNAHDIPGEGKPRRGAAFMDQPFISSYDPSVKSLHDNFNSGVKISGE